MIRRGCWGRRAGARSVDDDRAGGARSAASAGAARSTHAFGVADAIELARTLGRLPARLEIYTIEGADFTAGAGLSPPVAAAVNALTRRIVDVPRVSSASSAAAVLTAPSRRRCRAR